MNNRTQQRFDRSIRLAAEQHGIRRVERSAKRRHIVLPADISVRVWDANVAMSCELQGCREHARFIHVRGEDVVSFRCADHTYAAS